MKNKTRLSILLILSVITFIFYGCSEEVYENQIQANNNYEISFKDFRQNTGIKNFELSKSVNFGGQNSRSLPIDFAIDTSRIKFITSTSNKTNYTFRILPISQNLGARQYYNLVYTKQNNVWNEIIYKNTEKPTHLINEVELETSEMVYNKLNPSQVEQSGTIFITIEHCNGNCTNGCDGNACTQSPPCYVQTSVLSINSGSSTGGGGPNYGNGSSNNGNNNSGFPTNGGGGGGGNTSDYGVYIPNPFGDNDILESNNPNLLLQVQLTQFTRELSAANPQIKSLFETNNPWLFNALAFFTIENGLTTASKSIMQNALTNIIPINNITNARVDIQRLLFDSLQHLLQNPTNQARDFVLQFAQQSNLYPDLVFNFNKSLKSPCNVDLSRVTPSDDSTEPLHEEKVRFMKVYDK